MSNSAFFITIKNILDHGMDYVFPRFCVSCKKEGVWICEECFNKIEICAEQTQPSDSLDALFSSSYYADKTTQKLIRTFKYTYIADISTILYRIIKKSNADSFIAQSDIITFVPLHFIKRNQRGFNQAECIAKHIADDMRTPLIKTLSRTKNTRPQSKITAQNKRKNNLKNAFKCARNVKISGNNILLIDDIYTSGATMHECAKILKENGAKKVYGLVIAKKHKTH